jgi:hypothetical protein
MNKYDVVPCGHGCLAITANKWKKDAGDTINPFTFCPGMRVVDCFGSVVHIKEVISPTHCVLGQVPQYCYTVEESDNTYKYNELSGEILAVISEEKFNSFINEHTLIDFC